MASKSFQGIDPILLKEDPEKEGTNLEGFPQKNLSSFHSLTIFQKIFSLIKEILAINGLMEIFYLKDNFINYKKNIRPENLNDPLEPANYKELSKKFHSLLLKNETKLSEWKITFIIFKNF